MDRRCRPPRRRSYEPVLGRRMYARGIVLRGRLKLPEWKRFLVECAEALQMSPVGDAAVWKYPIGGAGGNGYTVVQPITESFLALDTWPDHDGAYLFVCSCKEWWPVALRQVIADHDLQMPDMSGAITLGLDPQ